MLLLQGFPQSRAAWHRVVPALAEHCTVIVPDLPGYGESARLRAADLTARAGMSKRALATDLVAAMRALGYKRFAVAGHDRGARVAYRMALNHRGAAMRAGHFLIGEAPEVAASTLARFFEAA